MKKMILILYILVSTAGLNLAKAADPVLESEDVNLARSENNVTSEGKPIEDGCGELCRRKKAMNALKLTDQTTAYPGAANKGQEASGTDGATTPSR